MQAEERLRAGFRQQYQLLQEDQRLQSSTDLILRSGAAHRSRSPASASHFAAISSTLHFFVSFIIVAAQLLGRRSPLASVYRIRFTSSLTLARSRPAGLADRRRGAVQMLEYLHRGRPCRGSSAGLWALAAARSARHRHADLNANVPVARGGWSATAHPRSRSRAPCAADHPPRHHVRPRAAERSLLTSANQGRAEYADPDAFVWNQQCHRLLTTTRSRFSCSARLARLEVASHGDQSLEQVQLHVERPTSRPPSSFQVAGQRSRESGRGLRSGLIRSRRAVHLREGRCAATLAAAAGRRAGVVAVPGRGICGQRSARLPRTQGRLPGDTGACAAEMDGFPLHEVVGEVIASRHQSHRQGRSGRRMGSGFDGLIGTGRRRRQRLRAYDPR